MMKYCSLLLIILFLNATKTKAQDKKITFDDHPEWNFSVKLKSKLEIEPCVSKMADQAFFISDIEGEFEAFRNLLIANRIIDVKYNWLFGKGKIVICGDLFDRGNEVPECLWLIYKLEQAAKAKGGYVHTILGNHDIMNLSGDLRYVQKKYLDEAQAAGIDYMTLYSKETELGKWLRTKNIIEQIGDNLCMHAGVAPEITELKFSLQEINDKCRPFYDKAKSIGNPEIAKFFSGTTSLFWYRGYFSEPKATVAEVDATLKLYSAKRLIVGHTIVEGNVGFYYGGKVLGIDVNQHAGKHQAALFEKGKWYKVDDKGLKQELLY